MVSRKQRGRGDFQPKVVSPADFSPRRRVHGSLTFTARVATKMKPPPAQEILQSEVAADPRAGTSASAGRSRGRAT